MASSIPYGFSLVCGLRGELTPRRAVETLLNAAQSLVDGALSWLVPYGSDPRQGELADLLEHIEGLAEVKGRIYLSDIARVNFHRDDDWVFKLHVNLEHHSPRPVKESLAALVATARRLFAGDLRSARILRSSGGANCIPELPVCGYKTHLCLTDKNEVDACYQDPAVFWESWRTEARSGDRFLLTRGLDAVEDLAFLKQVSAAQWAMARAAKPGLTQYFNPNVDQAETAFYRSGPRHLELVGYLEDKRLVEYSGFLAEDAHITPEQIYQIAELAAVGALPDGRPVETVRVVFYEEAMAQREKRPLLDVGAKVYFENQEGDLVEIAE